MRKREPLAAAVVVVALTVVAALCLSGPREPDGADRSPAAAGVDLPADVPDAPVTGAPPVVVGTDPPARAPFDRTRHSTDDPASIWVVVNKTRPVRPVAFRPDLALVRGYQVARPVAGPLTRLLADGDEIGLGLKIASAFRSYEYQAIVHASTVASRGQAAADRVSARAGQSEHQTGLAVDVVTPATPACDFEACFGATRAGRWLAHHVWRYGFVVRYQAALTAITGYRPEPWHLRYVGRPLAAELRRTGVGTLEEFFDLTTGPR